MKIRLTSFRSRIILTIVSVIIVMSSSSFYIYYYYLSRKIYKSEEENIITLMDFVKYQLYFAIHLDNGRIVKSFLDNMEKNDMFLNAWLFNSRGELVYPSKKPYEVNGSLDFNENVLAEKDKVIIITKKSGPNPFSRALIKLQNSPSCYQCHSPTIKTLGYIVFDYSIKGTKNNINFARKLSIIFTIIMVAVILLFAIFMHYKFVRKSIRNFYKVISDINRGDLNKRLTIPVTKELGDLGKSFNAMMDNFQKTQKELQIYHQKELDRQEKLATIGEMAARLAHEIRNPMMGIANAMEIMIKSQPSTVPRRQGSESGNSAEQEMEVVNENMAIMEEIKRQANRVNLAVSDLLKFSRSKDIKVQRANINEKIESLVFFMQSQEKNKDIQFNLMLQPEVPMFDFDVELIENVLLNLGINAIQSIIGNNQGATGKRQEVIFRTNYISEEHIVRISVEDTGPGIPEDIAQNIFTPFFTTKTEGTGLGLAIAKEIIDKHKGKIYFESKKGEGCKFIIELNA